MGEQSAARLGGDDYQHLYSWREILGLLDEDSPYEYAYIEHPRAGAADDLTLHPKVGSEAPTRFIQVKWHVGFGEQYTFEKLVEVGAGSARSLLRKLYDSWKQLRGRGPIEVWLVSNWSPAPHPDLGSYLSDREPNLSERFFVRRMPSPAAKARRTWAEKLGIPEADGVEFWRALRFQLGSTPLRCLTDAVDDRMGRHGLRLGANARAAAVDEIRQRIQQGGDAKRITRDVLLSIIESRGLRADTPDAPAVRLWIHAWDEQGYDAPPTEELDWTPYFDRDERRVPTAEEWRDVLTPQLRSVRKRFAALPDGKYIDLRGKLSLTAGLAVGAAFPQVAGFSFRIEQPTGGDLFLWRSDDPATDARFAVVEEGGDFGADLAIGLSISGSGVSDLKRFASATGIPAFVYAEPATGTGHSAIRSAGDAVALAASAKELIRVARERYGAERVHLFLYSPITFAVFLGQVLNAIGALVTYERTAEGSYQESVTIRTG
jgi:hypothetical protein